MSERQARLNRKLKQAENKQTPKKNRSNILATVVAVVLVAGVAAAGIYATWDKIAPAGSSVQETQTVADIAAQESMTAEELLAKAGLTDALTADSTSDELFAVLTLEGYASVKGQTPEQVKEEMGIPNVANDALWQDAQLQIPMSKVAEESGMSFADFATQNGLPAEITEDMPQGEAMEIIQNQMAESINIEAEEPTEQTEE